MKDALPSRLYYFGTNDEVLLGDRIEYRTLIFRRRHLGHVVCIPDKTGRELAALGKDPDDWLFKLDSGVVTGWLYSPEDLQPPARLRLIGRAAGAPERITNAELEESEARMAANASWLELAMPPLVLLLVLLAIVGVLVVVRVGG